MNLNVELVELAFQVFHLVFCFGYSQGMICRPVPDRLAPQCVLGTDIEPWQNENEVVCYDIIVEGFNLEETIHTTQPVVKDR